ncbi:MAG: 30S ribosomal protein S12 methylthiotransferase RimO [Opitutae bacterium]|nr:30S ribosomal protein S12 methylthiotransferase RimO [Opitutae bacterium]
MLPAGASADSFPEKSAMITVGIISLGCPKNQSDSEVIIGNILNAGMQLTADPREADAVVVNTCSFILDARRESLDAVSQMRKEAARKSRKKPLKIIVAGCMPQRYREQVCEMIPGVDAFVGTDELEHVAALIKKVVGGSATMPSGEKIVRVSKRPCYIPDATTPRARLTLPHVATVKIAEGCNHGCAFCAIPAIRGRHRSRPLADVVAEVETLVRKNGVKEINLIAQDTTYYGMDTWKNSRVGRKTKVDSEHGDSLATLLRAIDKIRGDFWVRIQYTHPAHWSDELIKVFATSPHVAKYVDIPLQHISDKMLATMSRETDGKYIRGLLAKIRTGIPNVAIRTSLIVGFPGETEEDFAELLEFLKTERFDRAGVFRYSREEGTPSATMPAQCSERVKTERWNKSMSLLQKISKEIQREKLGKKIRVLVDEPGIARTEGDAIEIDGVVYVPKNLPVGEFADVVVTGFKAYDLIAR